MATSDGSVTYNSQELHNTAAVINSKTKGVEDQIDGIMQTAAELNSSGKWTGDMYNAFKLNADNYKKEHIDPLLENMHEYGQELENAANGTEAQTAAGIARFQ